MGSYHRAQYLPVKRNALFQRGKTGLREGIRVGGGKIWAVKFECVVHQSSVLVPWSPFIAVDKLLDIEHGIVDAWSQKYGA